MLEMFRRVSMRCFLDQHKQKAASEDYRSSDIVARFSHENLWMLGVPRIDGFLQIRIGQGMLNRSVPLR